MSEEKKTVILSDEQKKLIEDNWDVADGLVSLTHLVFNDRRLTARSAQSGAIRRYLARTGRSIKTEAAIAKLAAHKKEKLVLTDEQKEFVMQHVGTMKPYEIARVMFARPTLFSMSAESMAVQEYIKSINPNLLRKENEVISDAYSPPKTFGSTWDRIARVTNNKTPKETIGQNQAKLVCVNKCMEFMNYDRFIVSANSYTNKQEREMFEAEFIRGVWDKPDLTPEEVNLYINLVGEYVFKLRAEQLIGKYTSMSNALADSEDGRTTSIALAESIKAQQSALDQSNKRQMALAEALAGTRSKRREMQTARAKSMVVLIEAIKEKEERANAIRIAEARRKLIKDEIARQETMDDFQCRVFGITKEEILD